jgi:hypothetical protein
MRSKNVAPSFVYFLSGVGAAAAVNIITATVTGGVRGTAAFGLTVCSLPWFAASITFASLASVLEAARQKCERLTSAQLTDDEIDEITSNVFRLVRVRVWIYAGLSFFFVIVGGVTVWGVRTIIVEPSESNVIKTSDAVPPMPSAKK